MPADKESCRWNRLSGRRETWGCHFLLSEVPLKTARRRGLPPQQLPKPVRVRETGHSRRWCEFRRMLRCAEPLGPPGAAAASMRVPLITERFQRFR